MHNSQRPASPLSIAQGPDKVFYDVADYDKEHTGFTKLELASLMIAQGLVTKYALKEPGDQRVIAQMSVELATEILNEVNK